MNDKSLTGWLGLEDFFNYYLPGLLWLINIIFLLGVVNYTLLIQAVDVMNQIDPVIIIVGSDSEFYSIDDPGELFFKSGVKWCIKIEACNRISVGGVV